MSRLPVTDLGALMVERGPAWQRKLPPLSEMESLELLAALGVSMERDQLARLAATLEFQPLLLTVYGTEAARRGIASLEKFDLYHEILKDKQASVSDKITRFVLRTLPDLTPAEKSLLFAISLFDAPPTSKQSNMLLGVGSVPHVTDGLVEKRWRLSRSNTFAARLREAEAGLHVRRLLRVETLPAPPLGNKSYQMHALVHGGAREILRNQYVPSWKEANRLVFKALKRSVRTHYPDRREDLLALYSAGPFGVRSGRGKAAGWMYATRCLRGFRAYSTSKHGMIYQDIEILSHFFEGDWQSVKQGIGLSVSDQTQAVVWAGTLICAVNKYRIGRPLLEVGIQMAKDDRNFVTAARIARNLSYMCALHGDLEDAARLCSDSVEYASNTPKFIYKIIELLNGIRVSPQFQPIASLVTLGYIHHFLGRTAEAQDFFSRGEAV